MTPAPRLAGVRVVDTSAGIAVAAGDVLTSERATEIVMTVLGHMEMDDQVNTLVSAIISWCAASEVPGDALGFLIQVCLSGMERIADLPVGHG